MKIPISRTRIVLPKRRKELLTRRLAHLPGVVIYATDVSAGALAVAAENCRRHGVEGRVRLLAGDLLEPLPEPVDVIVANLPYVSHAEYERLPPEVADYEPRHALDGGPQGLDYIERLLASAHGHLNPGGVILLTTPNVRGLYSHLEMFYLHFGHVTFYHPRLLCFFMEFVGFTEVEDGENPTERRPLFGDMLDRQAGGSVITQVRYDPVLPRPTNPLRWPIWLGKMLLVRLIVQPYLDHFMTEINRGFGQANQTFNWIMRNLARLDRPFECYAVGRKPER